MSGANSDDWRASLAAALMVLAGCLGLAGCVVSAGCGPAPRSPEQQKYAADRTEARRVARQAKYLATLPAGVADVRDEGGDNVSFTLACDGRSHRYLAHYAWDDRSGIFQSTLVRLD